MNMFPKRANGQTSRDREEARTSAPARPGLLVLPLVLTLAASSASACSVPVFRYALERWPADRYELVVFHRGALKPAEQALLKRLQQAGDGKEALVNLDTVAVNLDEPPDAPLADLWAAQKDAALPRMVLRLPRVARRPESIWAGPFNQVNVDRVLDSPLRRETAARLLRGESAVWVFIDIGDQEKDNAAFRRLENQLKELQQSLKLPELRENNPEDRIERGPGAPELRIAFSLLRLSRADPAEAVLLQMLLNVEEDLKTLAEPMVLPVFGRGRALYALVGKGINAETIGEACRFVTGPCGCEVKRQNPGLDLLMSTPWEATLESWRKPREALPPLPRLPSRSVLEAVAEANAPPPETGGGQPRHGLLVVAIGVAGLAAATAVLLRVAKGR